MPQTDGDADALWADVTSGSALAALPSGEWEEFFTREKAQ